MLIFLFKNPTLLVFCCLIIFYSYSTIQIIRLHSRATVLLTTANIPASGGCTNHLVLSRRIGYDTLNNCSLLLLSSPYILNFLGKFLSSMYMRGATNNSNKEEQKVVASSNSAVTEKIADSPATLWMVWC
jgi:hypothetical protein